MPFRFVHTADIHLDSPLRSLALRNPDLAALIGDSTRQALVAIVDLCLEEKVDALIVAGDLYDGDQTSMKTARFLATQMIRLHEAGIAVYKVRGNHDAQSRITKELILPPSLRVFGGRADAVEFKTGGLDIVVHGISFATPHAPESLLPKFGRPMPDTVNIGIMHTSLGGASGHDDYAPCGVPDLHGWGFDYWALGHIHARSQHAGDSIVVMPGMPQGRDINEAGPKTVSLVTVRDDRSIVVEERLTSIAQFERIPVDLSGALSWAEAIDAIERRVAEIRDEVASDHLVGRLMLGGETPVSWRLRRDRDLLMTELDQRVEGIGRTWIEAIDLATVAPRQTRPAEAATDPLVELDALIVSDILTRHDIRAAVAQLVNDVLGDLPAEARHFGGDNPAAFDTFVDQLLDESHHDVLARLQQTDASTD